MSTKTNLLNYLTWFIFLIAFVAITFVVINKVQPNENKAISQIVSNKCFIETNNE